MRLRSRLVAVAHAGLGEQVAGAVRVVLELAPQPGHVEPEVVRAALESRPPDLAEQAAGADQLAGGVQQDLEQPPLRRREVQLLGPGGRRFLARRVRSGTGGLGPTVPDDRVRSEVDLAPADGEAGALRYQVIT